MKGLPLSENWQLLILLYANDQFNNTEHRR
jgi:hypothetical protein